MRKKFLDLFKLREDGEIVPKYAIRMGGSCISPGVSFKRGAVFSGVDIFSICNCDLEVESIDNIWVLRGYYT